MGVLTHLEPERVFYYFEELCKIPHGSGNTKEISDYLVDFAKKQNLKYRQDKLNNVVIWKGGKGKPVILQGHIDMVCEKEPDCTKDMAKEGLDIYVDGNEVRAKGTTLGGDNGIAVAMALAILEMEDDTLPPIEAIMTVDEETGMYGAAGLDENEIEGRLMLNLDSEDEGVFTVSCAGGVRAGLSVDIKRENVFEIFKSADIKDGDKHTKSELDKVFYKLEVRGLVGGHSGIQIHKNLGNAIHLLGRALQRLRDEVNIKLITVSGGAKDNAIAVSATAKLALIVDKQDMDTVKADFCKIVQAIESDFKAEYATTDKAVNISLDEIAEMSILPMEKESMNKVIYMLSCIPNGVIKMSSDVEGLVQTSLNKGILTSTISLDKNSNVKEAEKISDDKVELTLSLRSSVASEKDALKRQLQDMMAAIGGKSIFKGDYPGWQYLVKSPLRDLILEVFKDQYGYEAKVEAIHAGVECGYFAQKLPGLDCVSLGPNLKEIHTPRESMDIKSVERTYKLVLETLRRLAL